MREQLEPQISGRMMLARLAGAISFLGRLSFFATAIYNGIAMAIGTVAVMCQGADAEAALENTTTIATMLLLGSLSLLAISSFIAWIITGLGDLVTFVLYLVTRLGTFLMTTGVVMVAFITYARFVRGSCLLANPFWIMFAGAGLVLAGLLVQFGVLFILGWWRDQLEKAEMVRRGAL